MKKNGPAPIYGVKMARKLVTLDAETIAKARELGNGNLSAGIRAKFADQPQQKNGGTK